MTQPTVSKSTERSQLVVEIRLQSHQDQSFRIITDYKKTKANFVSNHCHHTFFCIYPIYYATVLIRRAVTAFHRTPRCQLLTYRSGETETKQTYTEWPTLYNGINGDEWRSLAAELYFEYSIHIRFRPNNKMNSVLSDSLSEPERLFRRC